MNSHDNAHASRNTSRDDGVAGDPGSRFVFGTFCLLLWLATFCVAAPLAGYTGVLLACAGLLMLLRPPVVALPRLWWILAAICVLAGMAAFLPAGWFAMPQWRAQLAACGVETGSLVAIQSRQAAEGFTLFVITLGTGLWLAGHRPSPAQVRRLAMAFTLGVAIYAIIARLVQAPQPVGNPGGEVHFGFFPNRNHSATYLAMGAICGLGNVFQALRDKRFLSMTIALIATGVCLYAVGVWSISRSGVLLSASACLIWLTMLGPRYLGKHGLRALVLIGLTVVGLFFIVDTGVKGRLTKTVEQANSVLGTPDASPTAEKPALAATRDLDFRIPTMLDTFCLMRDFTWTGVGFGQYQFIFPQYRKLTVVANDADSYHPESDWLWLATEAGVPATLALAALVILAFWKARGGIRGGRDRALRSACLVAALLVPVHGMFDVPGHRITLAWSAALLFGLALDLPPFDPQRAAPRAWPFRLAALAILAVATLLVGAQWWGWPQPALTSTTVALTEAQRLYREDQSLQKAALAKGQTYQPNAAADLLEQALTIIQQAQNCAPLDRDLLRYQGFLALHFDDKFTLTDRAYSIERALDPTWVGCPLRQAQAWAGIDPQRCATLWTEALRRAAMLDKLQPGTPWSSERTLQAIRHLAKGKPQLEKLLPNPQ
jgi:hypothetical protein